jgi:hypothetical protein
MKLIGNDGTVSDFLREFRDNKLSHAFIIEGASGSGKLTLARTLSSVVVCENSNPPCKTCKGCLMALSGTHPDIHEILHDDLLKKISIDTVRKLIIEKAYIKPSESAFSVFIVENAHMLSTEAQNALLQIFEEPPRNTMFFLLATDRNTLLKTLLSRARILKTEKLSSKTIQAFIEESYPDKAALAQRISRLCDGSLGMAKELMESEGAPEALITVNDYFSLLANGAGYYSLSKLISPARPPSKETFSVLLSYIVLALRDIAVSGTAEQYTPVFFSDTQIPRDVFDRMGLKGVLSAFELCEDLIKRSSALNATGAVARLNACFAQDMK